jgi:hypothetical protein
MSAFSLISDALETIESTIDDEMVQGDQAIQGNHFRDRSALKASFLQMLSIVIIFQFFLIDKTAKGLSLKLILFDDIADPLCLGFISYSSVFSVNLQVTDHTVRCLLLMRLLTEISVPDSFPVLPVLKLTS